MRSMSFVNVGIIEPVCPARLAAARLRRAFVRPILAAPPVRATQPSILLQISVKAFSHGMSTGLFTGKEPHTKQKKKFPLELRAKTNKYEKDKSEQNATSAKPERESWLWKLYEKTLKVIIDAVLGKVWHR